MPSPEQERTQRVRRPIHPATVTVDALLAHLATDPVAGLSPKEAARRLAASEALPLFRKQPAGYATCLKRVIREPALWLMLAVAIISLFFERIALSVFCLLLTAGHAALCAYFLYRSARTDAAMQAAYDTPLCRVLRGGRILRMSAEGLVKGDILLLAAGDIIPADCRLIRSEDFSVAERELDASDLRRPPEHLQKDAAAIPTDTKSLRISPVNMVFAGGMAESGTALAVVVAVGSETHLGGLIDHIPSAHQNRTVNYFKGARRVLSVYNLCLLCLTVPLTALGIFTVGETYEFLDIFLSSLSLASVTLTEHLLCKGIHLETSARRAAALDRDRENTADIKSAAVFEKLTSMTDLLLVGTAALHDGEDLPESLIVGDKTYRCDQPDADENARVVAEYLYLYRRGMESLPATGTGHNGYAHLISEFCRWAEMDTQAFAVKVKEIRAEGGGVSGLFPVADGNSRITVRLTEHFDEVETCTHIYDGRKNKVLDRRDLNALYRLYRKEARQGSTPLFVLAEYHGELSIFAMMTYAPRICRKTAGCVKNLESTGIRVSAFLRDVSDSHTRVLAACCLTEQASADRPTPEGEVRVPAVLRIEDGCRAFEGCTDDYILDCIRDLKAEGRTVGVLSVEDADVALLSEADVAFTCVPSLYATDEDACPRIEARSIGWDLADADGTPDGHIANDRSRRAAHVLVRRSSAVGGGILGVHRALRAADGFKNALDRTVRFTLISQAIRLVMVILPICLGLSIASAPVVLLSGLFLDLLVMAAASGFPLENAPSPRRELDAGISRPFVTYRIELLAAAVSAALSWVVAWIASLCGVEFGGDLLYYGLLCTFGLQLAVFITDRLPRRDSTVFFATLALGLTYVGALAASLVGELIPLWSLVL
ncbi:MAG: hypothetical protein IJA91_07360, partial [Clostridia bacterium]|nr:hypothetical protein [Clostridia bacterium]